MTTYTDMLGQEISVGDFVVYATTSGRSPVLKYALVEKIDEVTNTKYGRDGIKEVTRTRVGVREIKNGRGCMRFDSSKLTADGWVDKQVRVTYPMVQNIVKVEV